MRIEWLVPNNAYVILFGDSIIDIDGKRFFQTIKEMKECLEPKGLTVKNKKVIRTFKNSLWEGFCNLKEIKKDTIYNYELWAKENGDFEVDATLPPTNLSVMEFIGNYIEDFDLSKDCHQWARDEYYAIKNFYEKHKYNEFELYKSEAVQN